MKFQNYSDGTYVDYTNATGSEIPGGNPVQHMGKVGIAPEVIAIAALASLQMFGLVLCRAVAAVVFVPGDMVGWDSNGNPVGGTAGTGCLTNVAADWNFTVGTASAAALADAGEVPLLLNVFPNSVAVETPAANVAAPAAITAANPAAISAAPVALTAAADAPAGGAGAAAGGWDTAAHRDTAIATINELRADAITQKAKLDLAIADVTAVRAEVVKLVTDITALRTTTANEIAALKAAALQLAV